MIVTSTRSTCKFIFTCNVSVLDPNLKHKVRCIKSVLNCLKILTFHFLPENLQWQSENRVMCTGIKSLVKEIKIHENFQHLKSNFTVQNEYPCTLNSPYLGDPLNGRTLLNHREKFPACLAPVNIAGLFLVFC